MKGFWFFLCIVLPALLAGLAVQGLCLASGQGMEQAGGSGTAAFVVAGIMLCQRKS